MGLVTVFCSLMTTGVCETGFQTGAAPELSADCRVNSPLVLGHFRTTLSPERMIASCVKGCAVARPPGIKQRPIISAGGKNGFLFHMLMNYLGFGLMPCLKSAMALSSRLFLGRSISCILTVSSIFTAKDSPCRQIRRQLHPASHLNCFYLHVNLTSVLRSRSHCSPLVAPCLNAG
jgi:hypothetical protein